MAAAGEILVGVSQKEEVSRQEPPPLQGEWAQQWVGIVIHMMAINLVALIGP